MKNTCAMPAARGQLDNWAPVLDTAVQEVFHLMLGCDLSEPGIPLDTNLDVTSVVGLAGELCGVLSVRCDQKAATLMASKMLGTAPEKVGSEMADALGEVCNMVAGNFKNKIAGLAERCMLSPPTVITGGDYNLQLPSQAPALELRRLFEGRLMIISLYVHLQVPS